MERLDVLVRQARDQTGNQQYTSTQGIRQREFVRYANDAQNRIYNKMLMERSSLFMKEEFLDVEANEAHYDLPTDIHLKHNVLKVDYSPNGDARLYSPLDFRTPRQEVSAPGYPDSYFLRQGELVLSPIPMQSASDGLRLNYQYTLPTLDVRRSLVSDIIGAPSPSTWTMYTVEHLGSSAVRSAVFGAGLYVVVGDSGKLWTSPDGYVWTARTSSFGSSTIYKVTYGAGKFVAVGDSGKIATSLDGITWTQQVSGLATPLLSLVYGNGLFVACGTVGVILTSANGVTWVARTSGVAGSLWRIKYVGGLFISGGTLGELTVSTDAQTWTSKVSGFGANAVFDMTYGEGAFVIVGAAGNLSTSHDNGDSWVSRVSGFGADLITQAIYVEDTFIIGGGSTGEISTSPDGLTWALQTTGLGGGVTQLHLVKGHIIACTSDGSIASSPDVGLTWPEHNSPVSGDNLQVIVSHENQILILGNSGRLAEFSFTSYDLTLASPSAETEEDLASEFVDYFCLVDADGNSQATELGFVSYNSTTNVLRVTSDEDLYGITGYLVFGRNASTHSQLPDLCERYLVEYIAMRIQMRDSSSEASGSSTILRSLEDEILESIANLEEDLVSITVLDSSMLNYAEDL